MTGDARSSPTAPHSPTAGGGDVADTNATSGSANNCSAVGLAIGWTCSHLYPGEWLAYTVDVKEAGPYELDFRVVSAGGGRLHIEFGGTDATGPLDLPRTEKNKWITVTTRVAHLDARPAVDARCV